MQKFEYSLETYRESDANIVASLLDRDYNIKSVIDIGCGLGGWLSVFQNRGCEILGVDHPYILQETKLYIDRSFVIGHDLATSYKPTKRFDLVICLEVAEHLPAKCAETLVDSLVDCGDTILFSAAIPLQGGQGHVNEQWPSYWIEKFMHRGYLPDDSIRRIIWNNEQIQWWYRQNIVIFKKETKIFSGNYKSFNIVHPDLYLATKKSLYQIKEGQEGFRLAFSILWKTLLKKLRIKS